MRAPLRPLALLLLLTLVSLAPAHGQENSRWDGSFGAAGVSSSPAGDHYYRNSQVSDMERIGNDLYVAGAFTSAGGVPTIAIARWDGERWWPLPGISYGSIRALAAGPHGDLYVGGDFLIIEGTDTMRTIARWDGAHWHPMGGEFFYYGATLGGVASIAIDGNDVYVSGAFTVAGGTPAAGVARWDGSAWHGIGLQATMGYILTIAAKDGRLYAGGYNMQIGSEGLFNLIVWDGTHWSGLATLANGQIPAILQSIFPDGDRLLIGGQFTAVNGVAATNVAQLDGSTWSALGNGVYGAGFNIYSGSYTPVRAIARMGDDIYVGGNFQIAGAGLEANNVARWTGSYWAAVGGGVSGFFLNNTAGPVTTLMPFNGSMIVGGTFTTAGVSTPARGIAAWSPSSGWSSLRGGNSGSLNAIASNGRNAFLGGDTTTAGGVRLTHVGVITDTLLDILPEMNGAVNALTWRDGKLYAGGRFTTAGGAATQAIAKWNGAFWSILEDGPDHGIEGEVLAIAVDGGIVYAGGRFTEAGGHAASNIARWDGEHWYPLGDGIDGRVDAIAVSNGRVYAGGDFSTAGGRPSRGLAVWDGSAWSSVGGGDITGIVHAIAIHDGDLIVGGGFQSAGGVPAPGIALFDGEVWMSLGGGVDGIVRAIAIDGNDIYVGGEFSHAGGVDARNVALWNGDAWRQLGSGINGRVNGIGPTADGIYFVGSFTESGGRPAYNVARLFRGASRVPPSAPRTELASNARPNPFTGATSIEFSLPVAAATTLEVLDLQGEVMATLVDESLAAGTHRYTWTPEESTAAGVYIYRLRSGAGVASGKVVLVR